MPALSFFDDRWDPNPQTCLLTKILYLGSIEPFGRPLGIEPRSKAPQASMLAFTPRSPSEIAPLVNHDLAPHHNDVQENGNFYRATQGFLKHYLICFYLYDAR